MWLHLYLLLTDVDLHDVVERLRAPALDVMCVGGAEESAPQLGRHTALVDLAKLNVTKTQTADKMIHMYMYTQYV